MSKQTTLVVAGESPYEVVVGRDLGGRLAGLLGPGVRRVAVVHPASRPQDAERLAAVIAASGASPLLVPVPEGEDAKSAAIAAPSGPYRARGAPPVSRRLMPSTT